MKKWYANEQPRRNGWICKQSSKTEWGRNKILRDQSFSNEID